MGAKSVDAEAAESQETMLAWVPFEAGRYGDAYEAIIFHE